MCARAYILIIDNRMILINVLIMYCINANTKQIISIFDFLKPSTLTKLITGVKNCDCDKNANKSMYIF